MRPGAGRVFVGSGGGDRGMREGECETLRVESFASFASFACWSLHGVAMTRLELSAIST